MAGKGRGFEELGVIIWKRGVPGGKRFKMRAKLEGIRTKR
jgi:hypothetical protein